MPRKSAAELAVSAVVDIRTAVPIKCPDDTPPVVWAEFDRIVAASPASAFVRSDAPLVLRLAETRVWLRSPDLEPTQFLQLAKLELSLVRALRLCPSARTDSRGAGRTAEKPPSDTRKPWEG